MSLVRVEQLIPTLRRRDAVGYHSLATAAALRGAELEVANWVEEADADVDCRPLAELPPTPGAGAVLHYQASTGAPETTRVLLGRGEPLTLCYHNVTPAEFFSPYAPEIAARLAAAREEIRGLCERVPAAVADSEYNAEELRAWGVADVRVSPPFLQRLPPADADRVRALRSSGSGLDLLFVGRVMPNKGHLDLLRALAAIRMGVQPGARLWLVGSPGPEPYMRALARLQSRLGLDGAVTITGPVSEAELAAHYEAADVYLSLSRHEGFGIPLVEAMTRGLPVVALGAAAVPETLGGAGVVLATAEPALVAEVVARVGRDAELQEALRRRGRQRATELESYPRAAVILEVLRRAASSA
jgi:L-malate glycosyltransferase